jgi:uncharacterized protein Yka (UPF0111/DUF47 family)
MFANIFDSGEHEIIKQCMGVIAVAVEANKELQIQIKKKKIDLERMQTLERDADSKVFKLAAAITSGAIAPNVIDDFLVLIRTEDDIVDSIFNLAREMTRYKMRPLLEKKATEEVGKILELSSAAISELERMLKADNLVKISFYRAEVEKYEEKGDEIKDALLVYSYSQKINFKEFHHINELGHKADDILDSARGTADYFSNIMSALIT